MSTNAGFAAALRDRGIGAPDGLATWNGSDPAQRFAIYRNNVAVALIEALAQSFPVTQALCGDGFFRQMAREFALSSPPGSPLLAEFGQDFPEYIEQYPAAGIVPYLADVARLEAARIVVWHGADAAPVRPDALARFQETIADAVLTLHPAHAVLASPHAIVSIWAAHNGVGDLAAIDVGAPQEALIVRPQLDVEVRLVPPGSAAFIHGLGAGLAVADAALSAQAVEPRFDAATALQIVIASSLVIGIAAGDPA